MNLLLLLKKVACAIAEMPFSLCKVKNPVVCMTLLRMKKTFWSKT